MLLGEREPASAATCERGWASSGLNALAAGRRRVRTVAQGRRLHPRPAGHRQDDRRRRADPPGRRPRGARARVCPEQRGRGQPARKAPRRRAEPGPPRPPGPRVPRVLRDRTLDLLVEAHPDARQARKFTREAYALFRKADKWTRAKPQPGEKQALRAEARDLLAEARKLEADRRRSHPRRCPGRVRDAHRPGRRDARPAAVRPGRDRRGVPDHRAGVLDAAACGPTASSSPATPASCRRRSSRRRPRAQGLASA